MSLTLWLSLLYLFGLFIKDSFPCGCIFAVPLACVRLLDGRWAVCWLCASVPSQPCAGGALGDLPWRQLVPREGDGNGQASAQRAPPGPALDLSVFQPARVISQHPGLWASSSLPAKPSVDPLLPRFHTLFVDF